jgi:hypothetical protein
MTSAKWWCHNRLCAHIRQQRHLFATQTEIFLVCGFCVFTHFTKILPIHGKIANKQWTAIHYFLTAKYRTNISNIINWLLLFVCFNENTQLMLKYQLGCSFTVTFVLRKIMRRLKQRHCSSSFVEQRRWIHKYLYIRVITYSYAMY